MHNPAHPGELLREWLEATQISITALAAHIGVRRARLSLIVNGHSGVTAEIDLSLNQALGTREGLWLDLQMQRDLWVAKQVKAPRIERLLVATKTGKPVVRRLSVTAPTKALPYGLLKGRLTMRPGFEDPLPTEIAAGFERR